MPADCLSGCIEGLAGLRRSTWQSAVGGVLPIALAALFCDTFAFAATFTVLTGETAFGVWELLVVLRVALGCGVVASVGVLNSRANAKLARSGFYLLALFFAVLVLVCPFLVVATCIWWCRSGLFAHAGLALLNFIITLTVAYWSLQVHRSLYLILAAGGSGWEYMTAEDITAEKQLLGLERGPVESGASSTYCHALFPTLSSVSTDSSALPLIR